MWERRNAQSSGSETSDILRREKHNKQDILEETTAMESGQSEQLCLYWAGDARPGGDGHGPIALLSRTPSSSSDLAVRNQADLGTSLRWYLLPSPHPTEKSLFPPYPMRPSLWLLLTGMK